MEHTISQAPWTPDTVVSVYPAGAIPAGFDTPSGSAVTTAVVSSAQAVTFTGLEEGVRYVAYAGGVARRFLIPLVKGDTLEGVRTRLADLEADSESRLGSVETESASSAATLATLDADAAKKSVANTFTAAQRVSVDGTIIGNRTTSVPVGSKVALEVVDNIANPNVTIMQHFVGFSFYTGTPGGSAGTLQGGSCESSAYNNGTGTMATVLGFEGIGRGGGDTGAQPSPTIGTVIGLQGTGQCAGTGVTVNLLVALRAAGPQSTGGSPTVGEARSLDVQEPTVGTIKRSIYAIGTSRFRKGTPTNALEISNSSNVLQWASDGTTLIGYASDGTSARITLDPRDAATRIALLRKHAAGVAGLRIEDGGTSTANYIEVADSGGTLMTVGPDGLLKWSTAANQQTTVGAAGAASALPATPSKYFKIKDSGGTTYVFPGYLAA